MPAVRPARAAGGTDPTSGVRSIWVAAVWTGLAAMLVGAVAGIVAVAVCWLPASGAAGNASSTIRAGLITFLAALHGGVTVDGLDAAFLPLGLTIAVAVLAYRAGCGLADIAEERDETTPARLLGAAALQAGTFAVACGIAAAAAPLGTSSASVPGAVLAGFLLFALAAGTAMLRWTALADELADRVPSWAGPAARAAGAALAVEVAAGALLVAVSLAVHHHDVGDLSRQAGGGWAGLPVLLLGALAAPNAAVAGASYLAGPGFAVGQGTTVALHTSPHGTLPAFPVLGALPHGPAAWPVWVLAVLTPLVAGCAVARIAACQADRTRRWQVAGAALAGTALAGTVLGWQAGGAIGSGRLHAVGPSPWQFGFAVAAATAVATVLALGARSAVHRVDARLEESAADGAAEGHGIAALRGLRETVAEVAAEASSAARQEPPDGPPSRGPSTDPAKGDRLAG